MNRRDTIKAGLAALGGRALAGVGAPVSPHAFGAVGDGVADDTAAIQAAVDAAAAARRPLELPPGEYKVTGTVAVSSDHFHWVQPHGAEIHCSNPSGPALRFAGKTRAMAFLVVEGLHVVREVSAHRQPMIEFGDSNGLSYFAIRNLFLDGQSYLGDGIHLVSIYDGSFSSVMQNNLGGIGAVFRNDPSLNVGNIIFSDWANNASPILFFIQEYYGKAHNLINSLHLDNCKHALASGGKFFPGSAAASSETGAQVVRVASGQGGNFARLDWVVLIQASTGYVWADRVASVSGDQISLTAKLPFAIAPGDPIIVGCWHTVLGGSVSSVELSVPHFERVNGILGAGGRGVLVLSPYLGTNVYRGAYLARSSQQWEIVGPRGTLPAGGVLLHQADEPNNSRNVVRGASLADLESQGNMVRVDGGTCCYWSDRFQGTDVPTGVWHQDGTVPASQSNAAIAGPSGAARPLRMRSRGSLVALVAQVSAPRTAGTLVATVFRNGTATRLSAQIDAHKSQWVTTEAPLAMEFSPGDAIDVRVTTDAAWAPAKNDLDVTVYVSQ